MRKTKSVLFSRRKFHTREIIRTMQNAEKVTFEPKNKISNISTSFNNYYCNGDSNLFS